MLKLPFRERALVLVLSTWLITLIALSFYNDASDPYDGIKVNIRGAVVYPGEYAFSSSASLQDLDDKVHFQPGANLKGLKKELKFLPREDLVIAPEGYKTIFLSGAVRQEGSVVVKEAMRLRDLLQTEFLAPNADVKKLKKNRLLKNQELVIVPSTD